MRWFPIRIRINLKRALFSIRNRWIPSPAENNDRAQISSGCWNDGCTKGSESGCVQGFGARLTKKIGKCVLKCVLAKEKAVDTNESTAFILVEVTGLEPAASCSQTTRATSCATPREHFYYICSRRVRQVLNLGDDKEEAAGAHNMHLCGLNKCKCFLLKQ